MDDLKVLVLACIWCFLFGTVFGMYGLLALLFCVLVCSILVLAYGVFVPEQRCVAYAYVRISYGR